MLNKLLGRTLEWLIIGSAIVAVTLYAGWYLFPNLVPEPGVEIHQLRETIAAFLSNQAPTIEQAFLPCLGVGLVVFLIQLITPKPARWSRICIVLLMLGLAIRYNLWRIFHTLNLDHPLNAAFSIVLLLAEMLSLWSAVFNSALGAIRVERSAQADRCESLVKSGQYQPSVDVIIPTYNEPAEILRRTVVGCQAMDYPDKQVYLLDDQRRPEIRALAAELGCGYRDRPDNQHALINGRADGRF
jgi:cellulose synthase (UDP-forming)